MRDYLAGTDQNAFAMEAIGPREDCDQLWEVFEALKSQQIKSKCLPKQGEICFFLACKSGGRIADSLSKETTKVLLEG